LAADLKSLTGQVVISRDSTVVQPHHEIAGDIDKMPIKIDCSSISKDGKTEAVN